MCDTFVAGPQATADGSVVFGKNSDREPDEAHELVRYAAGTHDGDASIRCTHVTIAQVPRTHAVLLAKPYWIWGAEMGANDAGVVIGNEALFNKGTKEKQPGLIGMDLLRLALERSGSAAESVGVITDLLARYGQSGQAGHTHSFEYDNSFLAADYKEAWIIETMGRDWVARRVAQVGSISNGLTTRQEWDLASSGVTDGTDVARRWSEPIFTRFAEATGRQCRTSDALAARSGAVTVADALSLLRHHQDATQTWSPDTALTGQDVCMHAGFGPVRSSQTTGSLAAHLTAAGVTLWVTGTSAPCTSIFKPMWVDSGTTDLGPRPRGYFDVDTLWWRHELLHRTTLVDYPTRHAAYRQRRDELEAEWLTGVPGPDAPRSQRTTATRAAFAEADRREQEWYHEIVDLPVERSQVDRLRTAPYRRAWHTFDRQARMPAPLTAKGA